MNTIHDIARFGLSAKHRPFLSRRAEKALAHRVSVPTGLGLLLVLSCIAPVIAAEADAGSKRIANAVSEKLTKLALKPRTVRTIPEKALDVRNAIKRSDFSTAHQVTREILGASHVQNWRYYPFQDFIVNVSDVNEPSFEEKLNAWVKENKGDPIPLTIRAQFHYEMGWFKRGHRFANETSVSQMDDFGKYMVKALADTDAVINLADANPYSFYLKLQILRGFGVTEGLDRAFQEAIAKYPTYYPLYDIALSTLQPKWGGSPEAMRNFCGATCRSRCGRFAAEAALPKSISLFIEFCLQFLQRVPARGPP